MEIWTDAIERFANYQRDQGRTASTIRTYRVHLARLADVHAVGPATVDEERFEAWAAEQPVPGKAWVACRRFYAWAVAVEIVDSSPVGIFRGHATPYSHVSEMPRAWRSAVEEHLDRQHAKGLRPASIDLSMSYLRRFARVYPNPWLVEPGDIARWLSMHNWRASTQRCALKSLRIFYRHAIQAGRTRTSPAAELDQPKVPRAVPRPAQELVLARALRDADVRARLMILLGGFAGLRVSEIAAVHLANDLDEDTLLVHGKGGHERRLPLHPLLAQELQLERERRRAGEMASGFDPRHKLDPDGWLFPASYGGRHLTGAHVGKIISKAMPEGVTAHMLRHRFATKAYLGEKNVRAVQELLGHASVVTTQRYTAVAQSALSSAVLGLPATWDVSQEDEDVLNREWARVAPQWTRGTRPGCPAWCAEHVREEIDPVDGSDWFCHSRTLLEVPDLGLRVLLEQCSVNGVGRDRPGLAWEAAGQLLELPATRQTVRWVEQMGGLAGVAELLD